ncbi:MAG: flavin reductase [Chloroflexi bacterium]|nr:flavin reductase [Chloroflexota bacterium]
MTMDVQARRKVLRLFPYGLYVVTVRYESQINGFTANWVTQCSFEPPMVAIAVEDQSRSLVMLHQSGVFAVNVLASGQRELAGLFSRSSRKAPDKMAGIAHRVGVTGVPILEEALGYVECRVVTNCPAGDHTLFVGEVVEAGVLREGTALTLQEAGFRYGG